MLNKFVALPVMLLAMIGTAGLIVGQEEEEGDQEKKGFAAIKAEFDEAYQEWIKEYRAADNDERGKLLADRPTVDSFAERAFEFINEDPASDDAAEALAWVATGARDTEHRQRAIDLMVEHHIDAEQMETIAMGMARSGPAESTEATLRKIMEHSPHENVRGKTAYTLLTYLQNVDRTIGNEDNMERAKRRYSDDVVQYLESRSQEEIADEINSLMETIKSNYADVILYRNVTLGAKLEAVEFERTRLQIGMDVPEIEGEDLDGVEFKLSDYRGKVVVLDFWGDW